MRISEFNKFVQSLEKDDLAKELQLLYSKFKDVKAHYAMELGTSKDRTKIFESAKKKLASKFATKSFRKPRKPRIRAINALLKELHNRVVFEHEMIDIYLYNIEIGNKFMANYYFFSSPLYNTLSRNFETATRIITNAMLEDSYKERCLSIINNCPHYELRKVFRDLYDDTF